MTIRRDKLNVDSNAFLLVLFLTIAPMSAIAGGFEIDWWTIDNGGTLSSSQGEWTLAGTLGQWDASAQGAASSPWFLEGGFWAFDAPEQSDNLFNDRFEFPSVRTPAKTASPALNADESSF